MPSYIGVSGAGLVSFTLSPPIQFIEQQYGAFALELENLEPLWEKFAPLLGQLEQDRFDTQGFGEWPGLSDSTLKEKERLGFPADPLVRTGELRDSLTDPARAAKISPNLMTYGTDVEYAHFHQEGTNRMPQRKVIDLTVSQRQDLEAAMVTWINEAAARAFNQAA